MKQYLFRFGGVADKELFAPVQSARNVLLVATVNGIFSFKIPSTFYDAGPIAIGGLDFAIFAKLVQSGIPALTTKSTPSKTPYFQAPAR
jgi:hypothetical protein